MQTTAISRRTMLAGLATSLALSSRTAARASQESTNTSWSGIELLDAEDRSFTVDNLGKPFTLIKLWAHWCPTCLRDLASLPDAAPALAARLDVVLVSHPNEWARDQQVSREHGVLFKTARPSASNSRSRVQSALLADDGMFYVPRTLLYSKATRTVVWSHLGGIDWSAPESLDRLRPWTGV